MISRRALLVTGGASAVILGGGFAALSAASSIAKAQEPWKAAAHGFGDMRLNALAYAILAPNPHNRQPWQIRLDGDDALTLFCDPDRCLPETDPPNRQIIIGLGAFLELLRQAAAEQGWRADIAPFPEGEPQPVLDRRPIASVRFVKDDTIQPDPLFGMALNRRTSRVKFHAGRPVAPHAMETIIEAARAHPSTAPCTCGFSSAPEKVAVLKDIAHRSWAIEMTTPATRHESAMLTRVGARQVIAHPDGISLYGPVMEVLGMTGTMTEARMDTPGSKAVELTLDFYNGLIDSASTFAWLTTPGGSRAEELASGAAWVRLQFAATRAGVAMQPLSQALQEFPEMAGPYAEIHAELGAQAPAKVQGLFRMGYADSAGPSPRWPLESRLIA